MSNILCRTEQLAAGFSSTHPLIKTIAAITAKIPIPVKIFVCIIVPILFLNLKF